MIIQGSYFAIYVSMILFVIFQLPYHTVKFIYLTEFFPDGYLNRMLGFISIFQMASIFVVPEFTKWVEYDLDNNWAILQYLLTGLLVISVVSLAILVLLSHKKVRKVNKS